MTVSGFNLSNFSVVIKNFTHIGNKLQNTMLINNHVVQAFLHTLN